MFPTNESPAGNGRDGHQGSSEGGQPVGRQADPGVVGESPTYEEWIARQPLEIQELIGRETKALENALMKERERCLALEAKIGELRGGDEPSMQDARGQLKQLSEQLAASNRRSDFYQVAHHAGVTNLRLGFIIADREGFLAEDGRVDGEALFQHHPELFDQAKRSPWTAGVSGSRPARRPRLVRAGSSSRWTPESDDPDPGIVNVDPARGTEDV